MNAMNAMNYIKVIAGKSFAVSAVGAGAFGLAHNRDGKCDAVRNDAMYVFVPEDIAQMHAEKVASEYLEPRSQIAVETVVSVKENEDEKSVSNDSDSVGSIVESSFGHDFLNGDFYHMEPVVRHAPTIDEVECAVDVVKTMPEIQQVLSQLNELQVNDILNQSISRALDADFRYDMAVRMEKKREEKKPKITYQDPARSNVDDEILAKWDELVDNYRCLVCQDVLAAPVLTPCSHSFCFHCVIEKANSCVVIDESPVKPSTAEIVQECSTCRQEFATKDARFERHLHSRIMEEVITFPESLRADWEMRRQTYLDHEKNAKEEKDRQEAEFALQQEATLESLHNSEEWRSVVNQYAPIFAFIVLIVLGFYRSKK